jgi:hypothetical protein
MKKSMILLLFASVFVIVLIISECPQGGSSGGGGGSKHDETPAKLYAIGDTGPSGVGIVFYITDGGLHGLEAAPNDQSAVQVWIEGGSTQTTLNGNTLTAIGTGLANSNAIIAQDGHTGSAAKLCRDYTGGGLTDWFLPSKDELNELYARKAIVDGFADDFYWSSSEYVDDAAWFQDFFDGSQDYNAKIAPTYVRAVRAF